MRFELHKSTTIHEALSLLLKMALVVVCVLISCNKAEAALPVELLEQLDNKMRSSVELNAGKDASISKLRGRLSRTSNPQERFRLCRELYGEYKYFQFDSALSYAGRMLDIADHLQDTSAALCRARARVALMESYSLVGLFKEADEMRRMVHVEDLPREEQIRYYILCSTYYRSLSSFVGESGSLRDAYQDSVAHYTDLVLKTASPSSYEYASNLVTRHEFEGASARELADEYASIAKRFPNIDDHTKAVVHSQAGRCYRDAGIMDKAMEHLALSAIHDLKSCTRETTAAKDLSYIMYSQGEIERADRYIHHALHDAQAYNSRHRLVEINSVLPVIENARYGRVSARNTQLIIMVLLMACLLVVSVLLFLKLRRRNKSLAESHIEIRRKTDELEKSNAALLDLNRRLKETAEIKDQYIIQSLIGNTDFIGVVEEKNKRALSKLRSKQYEEVAKILHEYGLKDERLKMYDSFDSAFLKLFPNFPEEFNALFPESERIHIDVESNLPTDVRIYALMRLGIENAADVARYLNLSVNTVYVYKTRLKSKSLVNKDDFDAMVMRIPKP